MDFVWALFVLITALLAARRLGMICLFWAPETENKILLWVTQASIGLAFISYLIFILIGIQKATLPALQGLSIVFAILAILELTSGFLFRPRPFPSGPMFSKQSLLFYLLFLIFAGSMIFFASLPPTDRDELIYHLAIPNAWLKQGGGFYFQDNIYAYFPQLGELLMLLGLGLAGELGARCFHFIFGFLLGAAFYGFSEIYLGKKGAVLGLFLFFTTPIVLTVLPLAYVDLTFALYSFLALICLLEFFKQENLYWILLAGLLTGAASATKYTGIQFSVLLMLLFLYVSLERRSYKKLVQGFLIFIIPIGILLVPYLIRNYRITGWPLFPFAFGDLPLNPDINWDRERARLYLGWLGSFGTPLGARTPERILLSPFLVFLIGKFNQPEFYEGVLGPVFLLTPLVCWKTPKTPLLKHLGIFSILFLYYWAFTTRQARFLIPILPVLCFILVFGLKSLAFHRWLTVAVILLGLGNLGMAAFELGKKNPMLYWKNKNRDHYLSQQLDNYRIYQEANRRLNTTDKVFLINMKNYGYYLDVPWRGDFIFERYEIDHLLEAGGTEQDLMNFFKQRRITHLMLDEAFILSPQYGFSSKSLEVFTDFLKSSTTLTVRDNRFFLFKMNQSSS